MVGSAEFYQCATVRIAPAALANDDLLLAIRDFAIRYSPLNRYDTPGADT